MNEITIQLVQPHDLKWAVDLSLPLLDKGLKVQKVAELYPLAWCAQQIHNADAQLWLIWKGRKLTAAMMTMIKHYPNGDKFIEVFLLGGWKMRLWAKKAMDEVMIFGKSMGCLTAAAGGRLGWNKMAKKYYPDSRIDSVVAFDLVGDRF